MTEAETVERSRAEQDTSRRKYAKGGRKARRKETLENDEIDPEILLEKARLHLGAEPMGLEDEAVYLQADNGPASYGVFVGDEYVVSLSYTFEQPERNCQQNIDDLWEIYVEPVIEMAREVKK